jgi:hypothetical protein
MRTVVWSILICLSFFVGKYFQQSPKTISVINDCPVLVYEPDTVFYPKDTMYVNISEVFKSQQDIILFVKYVKTQSSRLDDDNWAVMKTMKNRMLHKGVTFSEYFYTPSINNSQTIRRIIRGEKVPGFSFSWDNPMDVELFKRALDTYYGAVPQHIDTVIVSNVRAFESHPVSWNATRPRGVFDRKNIVYAARHEFYRL